METEMTRSGWSLGKITLAAVLQERGTDGGRGSSWEAIAIVPAGEPEWWHWGWSEVGRVKRCCRGRTEG